ncbi:MAG: helix-turn-helix transcriptional regulator [Chitinophaga sp.]|uniref:winged helix-turn-helix transcriptional regulator n=1 Tax=Chitinophaga sp. TaxID=1869181 RepID=UPI001B1C04BF|nr:helix-turn-helix domain-containing protein [Chitinophaga sp.]MBO9729541.1 helix-turn-helix transcriptional regulator [Chitinophaga sp.]
MKKEITPVLIYPPALCPTALTLNIISGKWKLLILHLITQQMNRFSLLEKQLPGISRKMLATQLRELEGDELITREIFAEIPPKVEYSLTPKGESLVAAVMHLHNWGIEHLSPKQPRHSPIH